MTSWLLPLDTIRQLSADSAAAWLPDDPNATRIRYTGGTRNVFGELEGATEERLDVRLGGPFRVRRREKQNIAGPRASATHTAITVTADLQIGDAVEFNAETFRVVDADLPELNGARAFCRWYLVKQD